jgi:hypothetical protein
VMPTAQPGPAFGAPAHSAATHAVFDLGGNMPTALPAVHAATGFALSMDGFASMGGNTAQSAQGFFAASQEHASFLDMS